MNTLNNSVQKPFNSKGFYVIIVAGGTGTRMNSDLPKQFMKIAGKPLLMHTIEKFIAALPEMQCIVVLANQVMQNWKQICFEYNFNYEHKVAEGGATRFESVKNGLALVPDNCIVGIHDAARPLVSIETIHNCFHTAVKLGNAVPFVKLRESIREINGENNKAVNRNNYCLIQTPQCFESSKLKNAFMKDYNPLFTDDASVIESTGEKINLVEGNDENIKITTSLDVIIAESLIIKTKES